MHQTGLGHNDARINHLFSLMVLQASHGIKKRVRQKMQTFLTSDHGKDALFYMVGGTLHESSIVKHSTIYQYV